MSKIFDALSRMGNEASEALSRVIEDRSAPLPPAAAAGPPESQVPGSEWPPDLREITGGPRFHLRNEEHVAEERVLPLKLGPKSPLLPFDTIPNRASEEYRIIRTKIFQHPKRPRMIVVSSAGPADGKTITAVNLAGAISLKSDANVLLLDTDFRRSSIAATLGLPAGPGLADVLTGKCAMESVIIRAEQLPNLYVVPAGECRSNPAELLDSPAWLQTCAFLRTRFGHIVLDSPPIQAVADYQLIQAAADGVAVVVRPDHTRRASLDASLAALPGEKLIGVVMNCVSDWLLPKRDLYGYSYYSRPERLG